MIFPDRSITDMLNVAQLARCCEYIHYASETTPHMEMDRSDSTDAPRWFRVRTHLARQPGVALWKWDDFQVVAISGAKTVIDQHYVIGGWSHLAYWAGLPGGYNDEAIAWAISVSTWLNNNYFDASLPTFFAGYSWGGSAASMLAGQMRRGTNDTATGAVTFGTPKFCDEQALEFIGPATARRVMNYGDPLPYLCPRLEDAPLMYVGLTIGGARAYSLFVQPPNGMQLNGQAQPTPAILPDGVVRPFDFYLGDFILRNMGDGRPHNVRNYAINLNPWYAVDNGEKRRLLQRTHGLTPSPADPNSLRGDPVSARSVRRATTEAVEDRRRLQEEAIVPNDARRRIRRIRIVKENLLKLVKLDGNTLYTTTNAKDARGVARALRLMLVQVQQQPGLWNREDVVDLMKQ